MATAGHRPAGRDLFLVWFSCRSLDVDLAAAHEAAGSRSTIPGSQRRTQCFFIRILRRQLFVFASALGQIFQPLYQAVAWLRLAAFYALVPNFAAAIALLTMLVMALSAPLTITSSRAAIATQRLQPEVKKLQQKFKGDLVGLNEAVAALYRDHGVNPLGGCLPALLPIPAFIVLYGVIRGLTHTVRNGKAAAPLYVNGATRLAQQLHAHPGHMQAFGINLAVGLFNPHASLWAYIPYGAFVLAAIAMQYLQSRQTTTRPVSGGVPPQFQLVQRLLPLVFAFIYVRFPAGVNLYVVVSAACRMAISELAFRRGLLGAHRLRSLWPLGVAWRRYRSQ